MIKNYIKKCNQIFEKQRKFQYSEREINKFQEYFKITIWEGYKYILQNYSGEYLRDDYEFKCIERTPLSDEDGYDGISFFFPLDGENSVYEIEKMYREQLPIGFIPIGDVDGGNLLCFNKATGGIFMYLHDQPDTNIYIVNNNMYDFIDSIEKHVIKVDTSGIVETNFSEELLKAMREYKE